MTISSDLPEDAPLSAEPPPAYATAPQAWQPGIERFQFTGRAGEYFGIWIVNLFLTIVTLGIYSAWAKVRKKRYFYGNTWVAGSNFEYHGNPIAILKGRVIAFVAFASYTILSNYSPKGAAVLLLVALPLIPWLIIRSLTFNAVNSSYRNLRFRFTGTYRQALAAIAPIALIPAIAILGPELDPNNPPKQVDFSTMWVFFVGPLVIMLMYPYVIGAVKRLHVNGSSFGTTRFACSARIRDFYWIFFFAMVLLMLMGVVFALAAGVLMITVIGVALLPVLYLGFGAILVGYTQSRMANLVFNRTTLGEKARFQSALSARKLAWIYTVNLLAIFFTLGLAIPWAAIRTQRYRAECLVLECEGGVEAFVSGVARDVAATGEAMGELFDIDLSL